MLSSRSLRRSVLGLLWIVPCLCAAQQNTPQFTLPEVEATGGQVASFVPGNLQGALPSNDLFFVNASTGSGANTSVRVGELLYAQGFENLLQNQINFPNVSSVAVTLADFNNDGKIDYAFALTPTLPGGANLCIYFGTGAGLTGGAYDGPGLPPSQYPPAGGKSGCTTFQTQGSLPPQFTYIAAPSFRTGFLPQILIEDTANGLLYIFTNSGLTGIASLPGIALKSVTPIPTVDGPGPITLGDFNGDRFTDFVVNGQTGHSATVYLGNGDGTFNAQPPLHFDKNVHSLLMQDMDGDGIADMVVEGDGGVIEIFKGNADGTFSSVSIGGTAVATNALDGDGGHLAAIGRLGKDPTQPPRIFTTTPIGLSVLAAPIGSLNYSVENIYNIGPGRSAFLLEDLNGDSYVDFAVDSPEGVAHANGDSQGAPTLQTSHAYPTLAPALASAIATFRTIGNPKGNPDVVVSTATYQGQLLTGNGDGTFNTFPTPLAPIGFNLANAWSNVLAGDFNGDGIPDIAYSLTGLPALNVIGLSVQYGNGDGTFGPILGVNPITVGLPHNNTLFGESTAGDFNGDGIADIANTDPAYDDTLLGQRGPVPFSLGLNQPASNLNFSQVAAGFFRANRLSKQDLVFQQGASLIPYVNSGDGKHFTAMPALSGTPSPPLLTAALLLADIDGDGNGDVVAVYYNTAAQSVTPGQLYLWYGNGNGTFAQPQIISLVRSDYLAAIGDLNNDGLPDILLSDGALITALYNQGNRSFGTLLQDGTGRLSSEQHFLAGQGINSLSVAPLTASGIPDVVVANGGVTISNPLALGGATQPSIALDTNSDINTGGITVLRNNVVTRPVTGTLKATPEPSLQQATFTITATLTPSPTVAAPTGFVYFYVDGTLIGNPVPLVPGATASTASVVIPSGNTYTLGTHALTANYTGDAVNSTLALNGTHAISNNSTTTQLFLCVGPTPACPSTGAVNPPPPYTPVLTMYYGQDWNGTTDVFSSDGSALTGNLVLTDVYNGVLLPVLCTLPVTTGGSCPASVGTTQGTSVGSNVLTSTYTGDATHVGSSATVTINVLPDTTTASVAGTPNPSPIGQPVILTATLAGNFAAPTGTVAFLDGGQPIGTAALATASGTTSTAIFTTTTLLLGANQITVSYAGNTDFNASTSAVFSETITAPPPASFSLSVTPTPVTVGVGYATALAVIITPQNGFTDTVNLTCGTLPYETTCRFVTSAIAAGGGTTLFVTTTAPHSCGTNQPYFNGSNTAPAIIPSAVPALAGLVAIFLPGRRRWLRALLAVLLAIAVTQITGCGNCTDLGTRPATYTIQVTATDAATGESHTQSVTINVAI